MEVTHWLAFIAKPDGRATRNEDDMEKTLQETGIGKDTLNS